MKSEKTIEGLQMQIREQETQNKTTKEQNNQLNKTVMNIGRGRAEAQQAHQRIKDQVSSLPEMMATVMNKMGMPESNKAEAYDID